MPRHRSYRTSGGLDSVSNEWTSNQLVIGIAVAIFYGLVCFTVGYVIARYDRPLEVREIASAAGTVTPAANTAPPTPDSETPAATAQPAAEPETRVAPETVQRPSLLPIKIEPLPAPGEPIPMVKTPISLDNAPEIKPAGASTPVVPAATIVPPTPAPKPAPAPTPAPAPKPAPAPVLTDSATNLPDMPVPKAPITPPTPKPSATTPTVTSGTYGVQLAAFNGPKRSEQAEESRKKFKSATGKDAEVIKSADGAYWKVVVTGFSTEKAAQAECKKIRSHAAYSKAWVIPLR